MSKALLNCLLSGSHVVEMSITRIASSGIFLLNVAEDARQTCVLAGLATQQGLLIC